MFTLVWTGLLRDFCEAVQFDKKISLYPINHNETVLRKPSNKKLTWAASQKSRDNPVQTSVNIQTELDYRGEKWVLFIWLNNQQF